jgi:hypothetical protein
MADRLQMKREHLIGIIEIAEGEESWLKAVVRTVHRGYIVLSIFRSNGTKK